VSTPLVSIVLLTRNGGATLPATLDAIARQRADFAYEIVAVDSGSTDDTLPLLERMAREVVAIPSRSFNHGLTRNLGIERASGELIVLLVQDALPTTDHWLARLTTPLRADARVAGTFCRQLPRPHATALTKHYLDGWVAASATPRSVRLTDPAELDRLDPMARLHLCAFDNVCSCVRRSVWQQIPFRETPIAEDLEWGKAVLLRGHSLQFVPDAAVLHSHDRSAWYEFTRTYVLHRRLLELFGLRTIPTVRLLIRAILSSARLHLNCEREATRAGNGKAGLGRALALAVAWPLGQYLGALSAARRWKPLRVEGV
jgi:glycosyltransferase involved in cell wall biosynthesis